MYWLDISDDLDKEAKSVFSGVLPTGLPKVISCPNCNTPMFPIFSFAKTHFPMDIPECFFIDDLFTLDVCAACTHSLKNYKIDYSSGNKIVSGGYISDHKVSDQLDLPYKCRAVEINPIPDYFFADKQVLGDYLTRKLKSGVYHQLGGVQLKEDKRPVEFCKDSDCELEFLACIDYDDLNVPLYEGGEPFCLVIGDMQSLNVRMCRKCCILSYSITE